MSYVQMRAFPYFGVDNPRHRVVRDEVELWALVRYLEKFSSVALDYETTGLAWYKHARICGVAFAVNTSDGIFCWYIPCRHHTGEQQLPADVVIEATRSILENPAIEKICHNIKFEDHMSRRDGIHMAGPRRDTMIEAHLSDENIPVALKSRVAIDLGDSSAHVHEALLSREIKRLCKAARMKTTEYKDAFGYSQVPIGLCGAYACYDVEFTLRLAAFYDQAGIRKQYARIYETEVKLAKALCTMEQNGVPVDTGHIEMVRDRTADFCDRMSPQIYASCGYEFNISSDSELRYVLQTQLGLPLTKKTKSGDEYSVDGEVLASFVDNSPACAQLMEWRTANKINTTYTSSILKYIGWDGRLHGAFRALGTNTGRLASSQPNMQNFPSDSNQRSIDFCGKPLGPDGGVDPWSIKRSFVRRSPEHIRLHYDYSQIELRVLAEYSQDPTMLDVYRRHQDIHTRTESEVFGTDDGTNRRPAKVINFGLSYCLSAGGLARQAKMPRDRAEKFMEAFFVRYPRIAPFREEFWRFCRQNGNQFANIWGRPRRVPSLTAGDEYDRARAERQAIGSLIQGTAAELTKESIVRLDEWETENRAGLLLMSTIHDEITLDCPLSSLKECAPQIKHMMEDFSSEFPSVPVVVDAEFSIRSWDEKRDLPENLDELCRP